MALNDSGLRYDPNVTGFHSTKGYQGVRVEPLRAQPGINPENTTLTEIHEKLARLHNIADSLTAKLSHLSTELFGPVPEPGSVFPKDGDTGLLSCAHTSLDRLGNKLGDLDQNLSSLTAGIL